MLAASVGAGGRGAAPTGVWVGTRSSATAHVRDGAATAGVRGPAVWAAVVGSRARARSTHSGAAWPQCTPARPVTPLSQEEVTHACHFILVLVQPLTVQYKRF